MRALIILTLALVAVALAEYTYTNESGRFSLVIRSASRLEYVGHELIPCREEAAAVQAICVGGLYTGNSIPQFTFNSTTYNLEHPPPNGKGSGGILVYNPNARRPYLNGTEYFQQP
ncbi:hypothetical protein F5884DRAFT_870430 [Xylogone sp. PMI_703]|nr:hypothetical protein F5884DRAFT_870430 [Xylogone sp. PMI_703]